MMADSPLPPVLYKYVGSLDAVKNILAGRIKFASFYELNDGTEAASVTDSKAVEESLWQIKHAGLTSEQFTRLGKMNRFLADAGIAEKLDFKTIDDANDFFRNSTANEVEKLLDQLSDYLKGCMDFNETHSLHFLCLSARNDSIPMWVHYAKGGMGFLVVFKSLKEKFKDSDPWEFNGLHPVRYHRLRPAITYDPMSLENMFLTKTLDWQYEEEIRVIKPAKKLDHFENPQLELPMKIFELDPKYIAGVVLGFQIPEAQRTDIVDELREISSTALFSYATLNPNGRIDFVEV